MSQELYNKLTDSARIGLSEITEDITNSILEQAFEISLTSEAEGREISLNDIMEAKRKLFSKRIDEKQTRQKRRYYILVMAGALYAVFGVLYYLYSNKELDLFSNLGLIIAIIGVMISFFAMFISQFTLVKSNAYFENQIPDFEIVKKWQLIEKLSSEIMLKEGNSESKSHAISYILSFLSGKINNKNQLKDLHELLKARNEIVHKGSKFSKWEKKDLIEKADSIIKEIENISQEIGAQ